MLINRASVQAILLLIVLLPCTFSASARGIHYGAVEDLALLACDRLDWSGKPQEAQRCYADLLQTSQDVLVLAEAAWARGDLQTANEYFRNANRMMPDNPTARIRWGELFVDTYQYQDAIELFNEALQLDPENGYANIGAASVLAKNFDSEALAYLENIMGDDDARPGVRLRAILLLAKMSMEESEYDKAGELLDDAGDLAAASQLPELEVFALKASLDLLRSDQDTSEWIDRALAENPYYADIYAIPAYFYWITRLYRQAGDYYAKAVALKPDHWEAQLELGINHLRFNRVAEARRHLEISYEGDPFNPKTVNTLRLLDTFEKFDLVAYPEQPAPNQLPRILLRLHRDETGVLKTYTARLADSAIEQFSKRYRFTPAQPVIIEIYPNHEDFIVRTIGMPGMGLLGVTFGYLLAMDSPSGKAHEDYHWGSTLWHELAHVFTLKATDNKVPRWFSEGVSVYEEWHSGPIKGRRIPVNVYQAIAEEKLLPIDELDSGFIRPTYPNQVIVSYMQAGLICDFIDDVFGFDKLVDMLEEYRHGTQTSFVVEKILGVKTAEFDDRFQDYIDENFSTLLDNLGDWQAMQSAALEALHAEDWDSAVEYASAAIELFPAYVESDSPYLTMASALANSGQPYRQIEVLEEYWKQGGYAAGPMKTLAEYLYQQDRVIDAVSVLDSLNMVTPFDMDIHEHLGDWLLELGQPAPALEEFKVALAMSPHDMAAAHYRIARAYHALEDQESTRTHLLSALEIAPHYRPAQKLLMEMISKTNSSKNL